MSYRNSVSIIPGIGFVKPGLGFLDDNYQDYGYGDWGNLGDNYYPDFNGGSGEDCYSDGWCFDGYGWYDQSGGYYDPNTDTYFDPTTGESTTGAENYYSGDYTEDDYGNWRFVDGAGNISEGGADGSLHEYDAATGEETFWGADGSYTWTDAAGNSYDLDARGNWTSTGADGLICYGDAAGNGGCTDGTQYSNNSGRPNPIRDAAEAKRAASPGGGQSGGSAGSAAKQAAQEAAKKATTNPNPNANTSLFSKADMKNLVYVGIAVAVLFAVKK